MLNKIVLINSDLYAKAEINLGDASSIQLVGQNNVGKSSLINTLNFLYITEPSQMRFEGNRRLNESIPHYFPSLNQSYIVFEIAHTEKSCILVKRTKENDISYYTIPHAYDETLFFTKKNKAQQVRPFDELFEYLTEKKIPCTPLNRDELYRTVYSEERAENPVLLLSKEKRFKRTRGKKHLNTFAQIYKHLIRSEKTSADDLTDMLIAASHTDPRDLTIFAESSNTHLDEVEKIEHKARKLHKIKPTFDILQKEHQQYLDHQTALTTLYTTYLQQYPLTLKKINKDILSSEKEIEAQKKHLQQINEQKAVILQDKGRATHIVEQQQNTLKALTTQIKTIKPYTTKIALSALETEVETLETKKIALKKALYDASNTRQKTTAQLKQELKTLQNTEKSLKKTIENFSDTLIQHISPDPNIRQQLNNILHRQVLHLPKKAIKKEVTKTQKKLTLFDGAIDLTGLQHDQPFTSIEELQAQLKTIQEQIETLKTLLDNQEALTHTQAQWEQRFQLLNQVRQKPALLAQQKEAETQLAAIQKKQKQYNEQLVTYKKTEEQTQKALQKHQTHHQSLYATKQKYETWKATLLKYNLPTSEETTQEKNLDTLYEHIQQRQEQRQTQKKKTDTILQQLSFHTGILNHKDTSDFIAQLQEQFDTIQTLNQKKDTLLDSVINTFVNPTQTFIDQYLEFKTYIQDFSKKLAENHISGIEKIHLHLQEVTSIIEDLQDISQIKAQTPLNLQPDGQDERLNLLRRYIAAARTFKLKDLFKLKLKLTKNNKEHTLDISKQMESYGTDKVLRIFIFLMLLKEFFINRPYNRVAVYIDEIGTVDKENIKRILDLCAQYNVLPIFASINLVEGFGQYYLLIPSDENQGKLYVDQQTLLTPKK